MRHIQFTVSFFQFRNNYCHKTIQPSYPSERALLNFNQGMNVDESFHLRFDGEDMSTHERNSF